MIESRVGVHDANHFELKLDYGLVPEQKSNQYLVETYLFIPRSLGVSASSYPASEFYDDTQAYIRFKTPAIALADLSAADSQLLQDIQRHIKATRAAQDSEKHVQRAVHDLKLLGCIARANIRDALQPLIARAKRFDSDIAADNVGVIDLAEKSEVLLDQIARLTEAYRTLRPEVLTDATPITVREGYKAVDEYLSLVVESHLTDLLREIDRHKHLDSLDSLRARTRTCVTSEQAYREDCEYPAVIKENDLNEHYVYRMGQLKKFVMSVLWLEIEKEKEGRRLTHLLAGIAAGAAMFFTLVATLFHAQWFLINSWGFIIAATLTYVMKDRMKEILRGYFSKRMTRWLADYNVKINDPLTGSQIGRCREAFSWVRMQSVPPDVLARRRKGKAYGIHPADRTEAVLKYEKHISLSGQGMISRLRQEQNDLNDIIRFEVSRFLLRTDDPVSRTAIYDPQDDVVRDIDLPKVYHVNVVMRLSAASAIGGHTIERVRVVLDKRGIRRLVEL